MRKGRDIEWDPYDSKGNLQTWDQVGVLVLMDLRDELKKLNRVFECYNFVRIPHVLDSIRNNTAMPVKKKARAKR